MYISFFKSETIMTDEFLTPEGIYDQVISKVISKDEAIGRLISLFEGSDDVGLRAKSLETLDKIVFEKDDIFKFLESCLISDGDWIVRATAAEILIKTFPIKSETPIRWAIDNDKSYPCVFRIFRALKNINNGDNAEILSFIEDKFFKKHQVQFDLDRNEMIILGMLDLIRNDPEVVGEIKPDFNFKVEEGHIVELNIEGFQYEVFEGLEMFPKLKSLEIMGEKLKIVKNLETLTNLKSLYIYDAKIENVKMFKNLENLEELGLYNNKISDTKGIENLTNLKRLDLGCNPITNIDGLDMLVDLHFLNIHFNSGSGPVSDEKKKQFEAIKNKILNNRARNIMMYLFLD
jgi:hypothetical protein